MKKILVTGGAGHIGSELADRLIQDPDNFVLIVDNLSTGSLDNLPQRPKDNWVFEECDVNHLAEISKAMLSHSFDYVFHLAAVVGVERTLKNPVQVLEDIQGIKNILDLSKNSDVSRVFYTSSSEVYGEPVELPQHEETTPLNSRLPYAVVKNVGESFLRSYQKEFNLEYTIFRLFNTYGPKQSIDFVISKFVKAALAGDDITIYGDGLQTRTYCFIEDSIAAMTAAFEEDAYVNEVVNIGSDVEISVNQLAQMIVSVTDSKSEIVNHPRLAEGDMTRRLPNISKMKAILPHGFISLEQGLERMIGDSNFVNRFK